MNDAQDNNFIRDLWSTARAATEKKDLPALLIAWEVLAAQGEASLFRGIGEIYERGGNGVQRSGEKAVRAYEEGIKSIDDSYCHAGMGRCYFLGNGISKNFELARTHFEKASATGDLTAQLYLGRIYFLGLGVVADLKLAKYYLQPPLDGGYVSAYILMSKIEWRHKRFFRSLLLHAHGLRLGMKLGKINPADPRLL